MTMQEQIAATLMARGEREVVPSPSRKYRCFTRSLSGHYWLGRAGALRVGRTVSESFALSDDFKRRLIARDIKTTNLTVTAIDRATSTAGRGD